MTFKYAVYYVENGVKAEKDITLDSDTKKPTTTQVFTRFKRDMGGLKNMKLNNISVRNIQQTI